MHSTDNDSHLFPAALFSAPESAVRVPRCYARRVHSAQLALERGAQRLLDSLVTAFPHFTSPDTAADAELRLVHYLLAFAARLHVTKTHYWGGSLHLFVATLDEPLAMLVAADADAWVRQHTTVDYEHNFSARSRHRILRFIETWLLAAYSNMSQVGSFEAARGELDNSFWARRLTALCHNMAHWGRTETRFRSHWLEFVHLTRHCAKWQLVSQGADRLIFAVNAAGVPIGW
jgi:hypothetical protein